jgi:hypothetical protein
MKVEDKRKVIPFVPCGQKLLSVPENHSIVSLEPYCLKLKLVLFWLIKNRMFLPSFYKNAEKEREREL